MRSVTVEDGLEMIDPYLEVAAASNHVPGMVVSIWNYDGMAYNRAFGLADVEAGTPMTTNHLFRGASIQKMATAATCMLLDDSADLYLDQPVADFVSELHDHPDEAFSSVTIREVLSQSTGLIRNGPRPSWWWDERVPFPDDETLIDLFMGSTYDSNHEQRGMGRYSNAAYGLLKLVVERASGQSFDDLEREQIISPLGLEASMYPDYSPEITDQLATGYTSYVAGERYPALAGRKATNALAASMGVCLTSEAACRLGAAFLDEDTTVLSDEQKQLMLPTHQSVYGALDKLQYGLGLQVFRSDPPLFGHTGGFNGFRGAVVVNPEELVVVSVLMNSTDASPDKMAVGIMDTLKLLSKVRPSPGLLPLKGVYRGVMADIYQVTPTKNGLYLTDPTTWDPLRGLQRYDHVGDGKFFSGSEHPDELVHFCEDGNHTIMVGRGGLEFVPIQAFPDYM
ncbi:MAG TPA: serine hydrolase domain-containing protein [Candidatus Limnocylindria bacterium]|nr:serine hydrolase domain-containing protein [Candidatus Limnocylindria bacterium]